MNLMASISNSFGGTVEVAAAGTGLGSGSNSAKRFSCPLSFFSRTVKISLFLSSLTAKTLKSAFFTGFDKYGVLVQPASFHSCGHNTPALKIQGTEGAS